METNDHQETSENSHCESCGAKLKKYKITLNKSLAVTLIKLRRLQYHLDKKEIHLRKDDIGTPFELTHNQRNNMSRLRFLGLARYTESHSGKWFITRRGNQFLNGEAVPKFVWTFRNRIDDTMRTEEVVTLSDVFRKGDVPYYEPIIDQAPATEEDRRTAVEQRKTSVPCARKACKKPVTVTLEFGKPIKQPIFCDYNCRDLARKER